MFNQKTFTTALTIGLLALGISLPATAKHKTDRVDWLFVITASHGDIKQTDEAYHLELKHSHVNRVLMFADRPKRIVRTISTKTLAKLWENQIDSFSSDPPNAVMVYNEKTVPMVLQSMVVNKDNIRFKISHDDYPLTKVSADGISLFIDSKTIFIPHQVKPKSETIKPINPTNH